MWICTPFGILMPALRPAKYCPADDPRKIQVRTRERAYLDIFRERYCPELGESLHFPQQDYQWKAYCTHEQLAQAMANLMLDIDFVKFKPETTCYANNPKSRWGLPRDLANRLHGCYNSLWGTMLSFGDKTSNYDSLSKWSGTSAYKMGRTRRYYIAPLPVNHKPSPGLCNSHGKTPEHWFPGDATNTCADCGHVRKPGDADYPVKSAQASAETFLGSFKPQHTVGSLSVPNSTLQKPAGITQEQWSDPFYVSDFPAEESAAFAQAEREADEYDTYLAGQPEAFGPTDAEVRAASRKRNGRKSRKAGKR
jgi:hypothetical protein